MNKEAPLAEMPAGKPLLQDDRRSSVSYTVPLQYRKHLLMLTFGRNRIDTNYSTRRALM